jgi:peptide/nickel transport system permease protein
MLRYVLIRIGQVVITIWGVTTVLFFVMRFAGSPAALFMNTQTTPQEAAQIEQTLGLNRPLVVQYLDFVGNVAHGNFGTSLASGQSAMGEATSRMAGTLELSVVGLLLSIVVGIPLGILSATRRGGVVDRLATGFAVFVEGIPTFLLAIILIAVFAVRLKVLPVAGAGSLAQMVLPSVALAGYSLARFTRMTRSVMLETLSQDYVRTARAKGQREVVVVARHALKNAAIPLVTTIGLTFAGFISGAVIIETVFAWPGVGRLTIDAVGQRDYPVVQAAAFLIALLTVSITFVTDLTYAALDPRVRRGQTA